MTKSLPSRNEVERRFTWNSESVFPQVSAWEEAVATIHSRLPDLEEFKGHLADSPDTLADWFETAEKLERLMARITVYTTMEYSCDVYDQAAAARVDRARSTAAQLGAAMSFALPEMIAIGFPKLREWVAASPRLAHLGHHFDRLERLQRHVRAPEVEEILSAVTDPLSTALSSHSVLANTDLRFAPAQGASGPQEVAQGTIGALLTKIGRAHV
jgi:oligoendopeptidase F